jgi:hypothetical protein
MRRRHLPPVIAAIIVNSLVTVLSLRAGAQVALPTPAAAAAPNDSACSYRSCALSIAPRWDGLAVVRGTAREHVANLHFFWPRDITPELRGTDTLAVGADSVVAHVERAVLLRRAGAGFTDLGAVVLGVTVIRALRDGRLATRDQVLAGAAMGALVISVPLQFGADGELSRAVWWHNVRFAR